MEKLLIRFGWFVAIGSVPLVMIFLLLFYDRIQDPLVIALVLLTVVFVVGVLVAQAGYILEHQKKQRQNQQET